MTLSAEHSNGHRYVGAIGLTAHVDPVTSSLKCAILAALTWIQIVCPRSRLRFAARNCVRPRDAAGWIVTNVGACLNDLDWQSQGRRFRYGPSLRVIGTRSNPITRWQLIARPQARRLNRPIERTAEAQPPSVMALAMPEVMGCISESPQCLHCEDRTDDKWSPNGVACAITSALPNLLWRCIESPHGLISVQLPERGIGQSSSHCQVRHNRQSIVCT